MKLEFTVLTSAKEEFSNDNFAVSVTGGADPSTTLNIIVADGVSSIYGSGAWANLVVNAWASGYDIFSKEVVDTLLEQWRSIVHLEKDRSIVPYTTVMGVGIDAEEKVIRITSVGDTCMFLPFKGGLITWPFTDPSEFSKVTAGVPVRDPSDIRKTAFLLGQDTTIMVATDGIAEKLCRYCKAVGDNCMLGNGVAAYETLKRYVSALMKDVDDDVTAVSVHVWE